MTTIDKATNQRDNVYVYGACQLCSSDEQVLIYFVGGQLRCAEHTRAYYKANPAVQLCDRCHSDKGAVRDPMHGRNEYLCMKCHADDGFVVNNSVVARAVRAVVSPPRKIDESKKAVCVAAGYGTECDANIKPRSQWGGKLLCNTHGKAAPKKAGGSK